MHHCNILAFYELYITLRMYVYSKEWFMIHWLNVFVINLLTPADSYSGCTAPLTSKCCILYIYSTNIDTEYFKHDIYSPFFLFKMQFVS